ncbi:helix-turn-helix transcriptional regulator [uncultured Ruegeria sp.]|uniref:helix-turn-helix transcriptional regulator n=1 Tax=uncultured Ruegeria sp. TaxID=259304 RepID=UPI00261892F3|nr:helix-turn-helix transcriptional regulator [uncultured Ruegeria sp.]
MQRTIPTIRAIAAAPVVIWMENSGLQTRHYVGAEELAALAVEDPLKAIPLRSLTGLIRDLCRANGPEVPTRIVQDIPDVSLTMMGPFAVPGGVAADALKAACRAVPYFSSHEHLLIDQRGDRCVARQFWAATFDPETLHYIHQYVAAVFELFAAEVEAPAFPIQSIELLPHPNLGLGHLQNRFKTRLKAGKHVLTVNYLPGTLNARVRGRLNAPKMQPELPDLQSLRGDGGLAGSVRVVVRAMLEFGQPSVSNVAKMMGVSTRTFQRLLSVENTSFSELLAGCRREAAADWVELDKGAFMELAAALGYSHQSSFTRAIRRWEGMTPTELARQNRMP